MTQLMIYSLTLITSMIFLQMNHPLAMGLMLLVQTTLICLITGLMAKTFWFSYILLLVFLGGMLVLFIYVTSLASNEMFSMSTSLTIIVTMLFMMSVILIILSNKSISYMYMMNNEMISLSELNTYIPENSMMLNKLYNFPTNYITIMLINYLLISLIAIVKITNMFYGPLRPMN